MVTPFDFQIGARTIWAEARGEPDDCLRAFAHVLVNRRRDGRWGYSFASVCLSDSGQFPCWNTSNVSRIQTCGLSDADPAIVKLMGFLHDALGSMFDPTMGSKWFFSPRGLMFEPVWAQQQSFIQIGNFRFFNTRYHSPPTPKNFDVI